MMRILLFLGVISGIFYLALVWWDVRRYRKKSAESSRPAYLWGLLFAVLFYYGFPLWWWRYGLRKALFVLIVCICAVALMLEILKLLDWIQVDDRQASMALGLIFAIPVRAIAGIWIAKQDSAWRESIVHKRAQKAK
jgi:hypothetical protein